MNRFVVHENPIFAAEMLCDQHILKMPTEEIQMLVSGLLANGAPPVLMPITKSTGKPHRGGYKNHPMTRWTGLNRSNFMWAVKHCKSLCEQFKMRYGKEHFAEKQLAWIMSCTIDDTPLYYFIPKGKMTPFPRCVNQSQGRNLDLLDAKKHTVVEAYRTFYIREKRGFATWDKGFRAPYWFTTGVAE